MGAFGLNWWISPVRGRPRPLFQVGDGCGELSERITPVDPRAHLAGFKTLLGRWLAAVRPEAANFDTAAAHAGLLGF